MKKILIAGGTIVTMNKRREILTGDIYIENNTIVKIGKNLSPDSKDLVKIDATQCFVIPGLIQAHTHLCQALFRGLADDLVLLDWLKKKIWPMESAHTVSSLKASAEIGLLEMHLLGTTSILDMATVNHTHDLLESVQASGMRYWGGKCLMDLKTSSGPLFQPTSVASSENIDLIKEWKNKNSLIEYALCPRFAISCTDKILRECSELQSEFNLLLHTHASESLEEIALVKKRSGKNNISFLADLGLINEKSAIVHGVHLSKSELTKMVRADAGLVHCPSSNLKLASGIAPIESYVQQGLKIGIGSDGAPCNNSMDPFLEMRLTALLQKPKFGPTALPAEKALELATLGGARVLRREDQIGSLEVGKLADIVTVDRSHPSVSSVDNPYSALVYSCSGRDVKDVLIDGQIVVKNSKHQLLDEDYVKANARIELSKLIKRI